MLVFQTPNDQIQKNLETSFEKGPMYQYTCDFGPQGILSTAAMASRGDPKVPKWSPKGGTKPVKRQFWVPKLTAPDPGITILAYKCPGSYHPETS